MQTAIIARFTATEGRAVHGLTLSATDSPKEYVLEETLNGQTLTAEKFSTSCLQAALNYARNVALITDLTEER